MSMRMTVNFPDTVYRRLERLAELVGRDAAEALVLKVSATVPPLPSEIDMPPVASLSDKEVLATADSMMDDVLDRWMTSLLEKQQMTPLAEAEEADLQMLMDIYNAGQLRKAEAMVEAVKRGLDCAN